MLTGTQADSVLGARTRVAAALQAVHEQALLSVDPRHLELCERRVSELLGDCSEGARVSAVDAFEQDLLAFVEQWVIDVASMTDELVAPLQRQLGDDGLQDVVHGLLVVEQRVRLRLAWEQLGLLP